MDTTGRDVRVEQESQPVAPERGRRLPGIPRPRLRRTDAGPPDRLAPVLKKVRSYNPKADTKLLERAYRFAEDAHEGQHRLSGEPYVEHPVAVTGILADLRLDTTTLTAALLHDTVEDTTVGLGDIESEFGNEVARIVDGLTKLDKLEFRSGELAQAENVRKMIVAMAGDIRVLLVRLADRLHNMRTLAPLSEERRRKIANETLEIHAPLADRLGVQELKWELEDLAFKTLNPGPYREIANLVETRQRGAAGAPRSGQERPARQAEGARREGRRRGSPEAPVLDLREDGDPRQGVQRDPRPRRPPRPRSVAPRLLRRARRRPRALEARPGPLQGLRRDAQVEHVSVAAHHGRRSRRACRSRSRSARRTCTERHVSGSPRTGATRREASPRRKPRTWRGSVR